MAPTEPTTPPPDPLDRAPTEDGAPPRAGAEAVAAVGAPVDFPLTGGCPIRLPVFEGPLDLLLHLIRENELEITDLPIAQVADQYLAYLNVMRELHLDIAAEYLVMAATLAWIKSKLLLPPNEAEEETEEEDPRAALIARLLEYQRFKEAAQEIDALPRLGRDRFAPPGLTPEAVPEAERDIAVSLLPLVEAFRRVLERTEPEDRAHQIFSEPVTVREQMVAIVDALERAPSVELMAMLEELCGERPSRSTVVATFLALLELARLAVLRVFQSADASGAPNGPIHLRRASAAPTLPTDAELG